MSLDADWADVGDTSAASILRPFIACKYQVTESYSWLTIILSSTFCSLSADTLVNVNVYKNWLLKLTTCVVLPPPSAPSAEPTVSVNWDAATNIADTPLNAS